MPTTLTLKNIPDDVYDRLKASAEANRRSMNSEAIVCWRWRCSRRGSQPPNDWNECGSFAPLCERKVPCQGY